MEIERDSVAILNRFIAGGEDPHRIAFVSEGRPLLGDAAPGAGRIRWLAGNNHSVRLEVDAPIRSLLVLTDTWYPGWTVTVDDERARIERVNWHFKGVYLEPGEHGVRFEYRPRGIVLGAVVSAIGLFVLVTAVIAGGRRGAEEYAACTAGARSLVVPRQARGRRGPPREGRGGRPEPGSGSSTIGCGPGAVVERFGAGAVAVGIDDHEDALRYAPARRAAPADPLRRAGAPVGPR